MIEVVVRIFREVVHPSFLLPDLDWEDGCLTIAHSFESADEELTHNAASFGRRVGSVIDAGEDHLVATTGMDGVHVVDKRFHGLMHPSHGLVDGVLHSPLLSLEFVHRLLDIVVEWPVVVFRKVKPHDRLHVLEFFLETGAHERSEIEVESRNGLSSVHLVLCSLHGDAGEHACGLYSLCWSRRAMSGSKSVVEDVVERMLHARERLGRIIVLVVDVQVVVLHRFPGVIRKEVVINKGLG